MGRDDERLRQDAAAWLARLRGPDAEADSAAFEAWRRADPRRAAAFARVEESWRRSAALAHSPLAHAGLPELRRRRAPRLLVAAGVTASLAAAAAALFWLGPARAPAGYATAVGEIRTVTLADGSRVTLDTRSRIALDFSRRARRVRLIEGRARFAIAHDAVRPFIVTAGPAEITDRGTVFDVGYRGGAIDVLLLQGAVDVRPAGPARPGPRPRAATLAPGQRVLVEASAAPLAPSAAPASARAWTTGMLAFEDSALGEVLAEANRYSVTPVAIGDPALARLRVTGAFRAGDPAGLARTLAALFRLRVAPAGDGRILLLPPVRTHDPENVG